MAKKSEWSKVKDAVKGAGAFKATGQGRVSALPSEIYFFDDRFSSGLTFLLCLEGRSNEQLSSRLSRALKNFGLNDAAGIEAESGVRDYHVIFAGPPRGGKATLIRAICGRDLNATNMRLASTDKDVSGYVKTNQRRGLPHTVTFWSTIGADQWTKDSIRSYIHQIAEIHAPIFLLFCVSPINVVPNDRLIWLIESCIEENVFCAIALTNIYEPGRSNTSLQSLKKLIESRSFGNARLTQAAAGPEKPYASLLAVYNHSESNRPVVLTCEVNSVEYVKACPAVQKGVTGVFELILTIMDSLSDDKMAEMIYMVLNNVQFWDYVAQTFSQSWDAGFLDNFRRWYRSQT